MNKLEARINELRQTEDEALPMFFRLQKLYDALGVVVEELNKENFTGMVPQGADQLTIDAVLAARTYLLDLKGSVLERQTEVDEELKALEYARGHVAEMGAWLEEVK